MIDWLNDNSGAVQAMAVVALVAVTVVYAFFTAWMACEMKDARHGQVLPVIDIAILERLGDPEQLEMVFAIMGHRLPEHMPGRVKNIGLGPALDVKFQTKLDNMPPTWHHVGHLQAGEVAAQLERWPLYL